MKRKYFNIVLVLLLITLFVYTLTLKVENAKLNQASKMWQEIILMQKDSLDNLKEHYELKIDSINNKSSNLPAKSDL